jgi:hypothetical protein
MCLGLSPNSSYGQSTDTIPVLITLKNLILPPSVPDPDPNPDPPDPHVFGPPGSGSESISQRYGFGSGYGSGSRTFCQQAKIVRKTLIPTVL